MYKITTKCPAMHGVAGSHYEVHVYSDNDLRNYLADVCSDFALANREFSYIRGSGNTLPMIVFAGGKVEVERVVH